jgi:sugar O-acyltransferase (sialic acid O-acetyltransferase NeuD family)
MAESLIILGASGNAYDVIDIVNALNSANPAWEIAGFLDDALPVDSIHMGFKILGRLADAARFTNRKFINAIGSDESFRQRAGLVASTHLPAAAFATLVHPTASVSSAAKLGRGVYVSHGASPGVLVGHDTTIGDYSILAPGACIGGRCAIAAHCYIGSRSAIRQRTIVEEGALVGMGAVVISTVAAGSVVAGNPAKPIRPKFGKPEARHASSVDVIIPCYRYAHFLTDCVGSVLSQAGVEVRALVIDDCSPDDTEVVGRALAAKDSRVHFRRHGVNCGHIRTYNEGIDWVSAKYTMLLSADDLLAPGALARAAKLMEERPEVGFVYGKAITIKTADSFSPVAINSEAAKDSGAARAAAEAGDSNLPGAFRVTPGLQFLQDACRTGDNVVLTPTVVTRTSLQKRLGGYLPPLTHAGDFEMWMRFAAHGAVGYVDATQAYYRVHGENMSSAYPGVRDFEQRKAAFDALFNAYGHCIPGGTKLRAMSSRALAESAFWAGSHLFDDGNLDACREYHELAVTIDPSIVRSPAWLRFRLKQSAGRSLWKSIKPIVYRLRGRPLPTSEGGTETTAISGAGATLATPGKSATPASNASASSASASSDSASSDSASRASVKPAIPTAGHP